MTKKNKRLAEKGKSCNFDESGEDPNENEWGERLTERS